MTDDFAWWLVGLVDGEGHFGITVASHRKQPFYRCVFRVAMVAEDRALLEDVCERTGWGRLYQYPRKGVAHREVAIWNVTTKEVGAVADFFVAHPLRSKKAEDFAIWEPAARAQAQRRQNGPVRDEALAAIMEDAYLKLRALNRGGRLEVVA